METNLTKLDFDLKVRAPLPVRLVNYGTTGGKLGRLEIFLNGQWGPVCGGQHNDSVAVVVCRMLGLSGGRVNMGNYPDEFGAWFDRHDRRSVAGLVCGGNE